MDGDWSYEVANHEKSLSTDAIENNLFFLSDFTMFHFVKLLS